jgi:hypothetical protein
MKGQAGAVVALPELTRTIQHGMLQLARNTGITYVVPHLLE